MKYTLTYTQEKVRSWELYALVGRITDEKDFLIFQDEIVYGYTPETLAEGCQKAVPSMTGVHQMESGESWRTFRLP